MTTRDDGPSELFEPGRMSIMRRIRRLVGREDGPSVRRAMSALRNAHPLGYGVIVPPRGPFDEPPAEPVELDEAALPWELRDEGDGGSPR